MSSRDMLAQMQELRKRLPEPSRLARVEVGQAVLDWFKAAFGPEKRMPPPLGGSLLGVPVVLRDDLDPGAWRLIDHDGELAEEGVLRWLDARAPEQTGDADG